MASSDQARLDEDAPDDPDERALFRLELRRPSGGPGSFEFDECMYVKKYYTFCL